MGALVCMHAEAGGPIEVLVERARAAGQTAPIHHALTRPDVAEATGTERAIALAELAEVPLYIVHLSASRALDRVSEGRSRGLDLHAETCPHYLFCSEDDLRGHAGDPFEGAKFVCTPPLRQQQQQEALWHGLRSSAIEVVATDHCAFCMKGQRELGRHDFSKIPNGLPGIETRLHLLHDGVVEGRLSLNRFVEVTATAPAKIFGLYPRKGSLAIGADADVVVWDPRRSTTLSQATLHMRVDYSPYEGKIVTGAPAQVLSRGEVIADEGRWLGRGGRGRYVRRSTR